MKKSEQNSIKKFMKEYHRLNTLKYKLIGEKEQKILEYDTKIAAIDDTINEYKPFLKKIESIEKQEKTLQKNIESLFENKKNENTNEEKVETIEEQQLIF